MKQVSKKINPSHPEEWPVGIKITAMAVVFIVISALGYYLFVSAKFTKIDKQQQYFEDMQQQYTKTYRKYRKFKQFEINLNADKGKLDKIIESLPNKTNTADINNAIQTSASQSGIQITSFKSLPSESYNFYVLTPITIKAIANYHQAATFISKIANLEQIIIIGDFSLSKSSNKNQKRLDFSITLNLYQPKELTNEQS